jgi:hypothetical protein
MTTNAAEMSTERKDRLAALLEKEKAELDVEERARAKSKGMGGFLSNEQKKVFGGHGGLEERLRRSRAGLVAQVDWWAPYLISSSTIRIFFSHLLNPRGAFIWRSRPEILPNNKSNQRGSRIK